MNVVRRFSSVFAAMIVCCPGLLIGDEVESEPEAKEVSYHKDIRPILRQHCQGCHQPAKPEGQFELTTYEGMLKAGQSTFAAVVPGNVDESYVLDLIYPVSGKAKMPKDRPPLSEREIGLIETWIEQGAKNDAPLRDGPLIDADHAPVYHVTPAVTSVDFSSDGKLLAVSAYHEVVLHRSDGSGIVARLVGLAERIESAVFSPDGKRLAVTGGSPGRFGEVQVWDVEKRALALSVPVTYDTIYGASWSPDGKIIAFGCSDNTVRAIDAESGEQVLYQGAHNDWVLDTVFSKDGSHLISVSRDMSMKLIEVATDRFVDNITSITPGALKGGLIAVDRHPSQDQVIVGGSDGTPKLFRIYRLPDQQRKIGDDYNLIRNYGEMPGRIYSAAFNQDGSWAAFASSLDGHAEIRVYETESGKMVSRFADESGGFYAVAFHPTEKTIAASGFDGMVRLIQADTGELVNEFSSVPLEPPSIAAGDD